MIARIAPRTPPIRLGVALLLGLPLALLALLPGAASARALHAGFSSSDPSPDAILKAAPTTITIRYLENVKPEGSDIVVYDAKHQMVSTGAAKVDTADLKTMTVGMRGNGADTYLVEWHNVSADDGDPDIGGFVFHVNVNGALPTGSAALPTGSAASKGSSSGAPAWVVVLVGVLGLIVGGAGGALASRRRGTH